MNMTSQTSAVIDIFTQKNVTNSAAYEATLPIKKRDLDGLPLQVAVLASRAAEKKPSTWLTIALVMLAHALVVYLLSYAKANRENTSQPCKTDDGEHYCAALTRT